MGAIIIVLLCIGLILHRKLSAFWELGKMPNNFQFLKHVILFNIITAVNFIWLFGFIAGIILTVLTFTQVIYSSFLWPFMIPDIISDLKNLDKNQEDFANKIKQPSKIVYNSWRVLNISLLGLTILSFFITDFSSLFNEVFELSGESILNIIIFSVVAIIIGNVLRIITIKILFRNSDI